MGHGPEIIRLCKGLLCSGGCSSLISNFASPSIKLRPVTYTLDLPVALLQLFEEEISKTSRIHVARSWIPCSPAAILSRSSHRRTLRSSHKFVRNSQVFRIWDGRDGTLAAPPTVEQTGNGKSWSR